METKKLLFIPMALITLLVAGCSSAGEAGYAYLKTPTGEIIEGHVDSTTFYNSHVRIIIDGKQYRTHPVNILIEDNGGN